ncbi:MAG: nucleotide exchange factor GrpE [Betaproteobacteria bacterium]|nr:nucleotide exchange factor GrpE [Betaproteobacteria bacterium]
MSESNPETRAAEGSPASAEEKTLDKLLAEAQARIEEQREAWMRAVAEADNTRKRARADVAAAHKYGVERFAETLLPVMDSLETALQAKDVSAIELTYRQLKASLEKASIREINPGPGERFDPHVHQAMAAVESAAEPNTVVEVMQKGYSLHDRVLRPALVTVAKAVESGPGNPISDTGLDSN